MVQRTPWHRVLMSCSSAWVTPTVARWQRRWRTAWGKGACLECWIETRRRDQRGSSKRDARGGTVNGWAAVKGLEEVQVAEMAVVVPMGCEVECPMPKGFTGRLVEWNIPDPGDDLQLGREVRGLIERRVTALLAEL